MCMDDYGPCLVSNHNLIPRVPPPRRAPQNGLVGTPYTSVPILYISLTDEEERRRSLGAQLGRFDLKAQWVTAVDARELPPDTGVDEGLTPGQVACWMSHRRAWDQARQQGMPEVCIAEDDLYWLSDPRPYLRNGYLGEHGLDVLQLGSISYRFPERSTAMTLLKRVAWTAHVARRVNRRFSELDASIRAYLIRKSAHLLAEYRAAGGSVRVVPSAFGAGTHSYTISLRGIETIEGALRAAPARHPIDGFLSRAATDSLLSVGRLDPGLSTQYPYPSRIR